MAAESVPERAGLAATADGGDPTAAGADAAVSTWSWKIKTAVFLFSAVFVAIRLGSARGCSVAGPFRLRTPMLRSSCWTCSGF